MSEYVRKPNAITDKTGQYPADVTAENQLVVTLAGDTPSVVEILGGGTLFGDQVTLSAATAAMVVAADATRGSIAIINLGTNDVYIGFDNSVDATNGFLLLGLKGAFVTIPTSAEVWAFSTPGATIAFMTVSQ